MADDSIDIDNLIMYRGKLVSLSTRHKLRHLDLPKPLVGCPDASFSITSLLKFDKIPSALTTLDSKNEDPSLWFSDKFPQNTSSLSLLSQLPLPPSSVVARLVKFAEARLCDPECQAPNSVVPLHLLSLGSQVDALAFPTALPLWIVAFWEEAHRAQASRHKWKASVRWMNEKVAGVAEGRRWMERVLVALSGLRWTDNLCGPEVGYGDVESISTYLSNCWLSGSQIYHITSIIRNKLHVACPLFNPIHTILNVDDGQQIIKAYKSRNDSSPNRSYRTLKGIAEDLKQGVKKSVGGILHINGNHYTFYVLNPSEGWIGYGDSMGGAIPGATLAAFRWWMLSAGLENGGPDVPNVEVRDLAVTTQTDYHSCGILSTNGLAHHYLPQEVALIPKENIKYWVAVERMRAVIEIAKLHAECYPEVSQTMGQSLETVATEPDIQPSLWDNLPTSSNLPAIEREDESTPEDHELAMSSDSGWDAGDSDCCMDDDDAPFGSSLHLKPRSHIKPPETRESETPSIPSKRNHEISSYHLSGDETPFSDTSSKSNSSIQSAHAWYDGAVGRAIAALKPQHNSQANFFKPVPTKSTKVMSDYYPKVDRATWREEERLRSLHTAERRAEEHEEVVARQATEKAQKEKDKRERARKRKRDSRKRQRDAEIEQGVRNPDGKRRKVCHLDSTGNIQEPNVAELSRPQRQYSEDERQKKKPIGRPRTRTKQPAKYVNWQSPHLWSQINAAVTYVGYPWSPTAITSRLQKLNPTDFGGFKAQRISDWRDMKVTAKFQWTESVLARAKKGNRPGGKVTRFGVLSPYPKLKEEIKGRLRDLRKAGAALDVITVRGIMVGYITHHAPEVFQKVNKSGKHFRCSDAFVKSFLSRELNWTMRRGTQAAQKVPNDVDKLLQHAFFRLAAFARDESVPPPLFVNSDQTQKLFSPGDHLTYAEKGSQQVAIVGAEEKRAFTLMVGVSLGGEVLPFQAIYTGSNPKRSLPHPSSPCYNEAMALGIRLEVSKTDTYWSTQATMKSYVTNILAPYFEKHRKRLNLPDQKCIWQIDVWSVHRSEEFRTWMKKEYPWIGVFYVPGGCTGLFQPCDVGIQRVLKHSMKRKAHEHIVQETLEQLSQGVPAEKVMVSKTIRTLRDRSIEWMVAGYKAINKPEFVKRAFELCKASDRFNLSYASLTSREARQELLAFRTTDPDFYAELTSATTYNPGEEEKNAEMEDVQEPSHGEFESSLPTNKVVASVMSATSAMDLHDTATKSAEDDSDDEYKGEDDSDAEVPAMQDVDDPPEEHELGRGRRVRTTSRRYAGAEWTRHDDDAESDGH